MVVTSDDRGSFKARSKSEESGWRALQPTLQTCTLRDYQLLNSVQIIIQSLIANCVLSY